MDYRSRILLDHAGWRYQPPVLDAPKLWHFAPDGQGSHRAASEVDAGFGGLFSRLAAPFRRDGTRARATARGYGPRGEGAEQPGYRNADVIAACARRQPHAAARGMLGTERFVDVDGRDAGRARRCIAQRGDG